MTAPSRRIVPSTVYPPVHSLAGPGGMHHGPFGKGKESPLNPAPVNGRDPKYGRALLEVADGGQVPSGAGLQAESLPVLRAFRDVRDRQPLVRNGSRFTPLP
jgi:hypothetical protein